MRPADIVRRVLITLAVLGCIGLLVIAAQRADTGELRPRRAMMKQIEAIR